MDQDLNALLQLAVEQHNYLLLAVVAVLIIAPIVLKLLGKSIPGQELIVSALKGLAQFLGSRSNKLPPPPENETKGAAAVIQIVPEEDKKE